MRLRCTQMLMSLTGVLAAAVLLAVGAHAAPEPARSGEVGVMVGAVSYRHDRSLQYTIDDLTRQPPQPVIGAVVERLASGEEKGCCLSLPNKWRPGMKVRVSWQESEGGRLDPQGYTRDLEIPRYASPADLFVVFYAGHEVEVVVSAAEPGQTAWKGKIKKTPWDACMASAGRKVCSNARPDPIFAGLRQVCVESPSEPNCQVFFDYCKKHQDEGSCAP